ncbi:hypothetical protein QFC22_005522 [Naganishia vaughanmartiniae]|uniref:Uncharacterized protein n=1 Tax=Naganishia vaughanmartiniae TaxID=1424756 RepID=A0ACC2WU56_9TREE|nr:hypothetical protein QFC22_005522 [Naganishia vaughanmartiniae]
MSMSTTTSPSATTHLQSSGSGGGSTLWPAPTAMSSIRDFPHPLPPSAANPNVSYGHPPYHPGHPVSNTPSVMASTYNPQHQQLPSFSTAMGWTSQAATYAGPGPSVMGMAPRRSSKDISADFTESSEGSIVLGRDLGRERAPRSMMACVRCRKQKMKCDGPAAAPCRGCRGANVTCVFETRTRSSRPKSISILGPGPPQPLPAIISSGTDMPPGHLSSHQSSRSLDPYTLPAMTTQGAGPASPLYNRGREMLPMRPPPGPSTPSERNLAAHLSSQQQQQHQQPVTMTTPRPTTATSFATPGPQIGYTSAQNLPPPGSVTFATPALSPSIHRTASPPQFRPTSDFESRLRQVENSARASDQLRSEFSGLRNTVKYLEVQVRQLTNDLIDIRSQVAPPALQPKIKESSSPGHRVPISERIWDAYHAYITSLAPWLPTLTSPNGLSGEVIACLGSRIQNDPEQSPVVRGELFREELSRLVVSGQPWREEDVLAACVFATWEGQSALISTAVSQVKTGIRWSAVEQAPIAEARYMVELAVMEQMISVLNVPETVNVTAYASLAETWRAKMRSANAPSPIDRDRDQKLLLWAEYAETFKDLQTAMNDNSFDHGTPGVRPSTSGAKITSPSLASITDPASPKEQSEPTYSFQRRREFIREWDSWRNQWEASGAPMTSVPLIQSMVRQAYDCLGGEQQLRDTLLAEVVSSGEMVKKEIVNLPASKDLWRKVIGGF